MHQSLRPTSPVGLYDPTNEHDACGVAFVARLNGVPTHETVQKALRALENLEHRGAAGADPNTGDGAGILLQMPHEFFAGVVEGLPDAGDYGVCVCFRRQDEEWRAGFESALEDATRAEGQEVIGWRDVPIDTDFVGVTAGRYAPRIRQLFVGAGTGFAGDRDAF